MRELFFFYERFGDVSKKRISDNLYIRNSTSFIYIIFNNSLLRLRVTGKLYPGTCKLSLSVFMSVPRSSDEKSKRGGGIIIYGIRSIYIYIYTSRWSCNSASQKSQFRKSERLKELAGE